MENLPIRKIAVSFFLISIVAIFIAVILNYKYYIMSFSANNTTINAYTNDKKLSPLVIGLFMAAPREIEFIEASSGNSKTLISTVNDNIFNKKNIIFSNPNYLSRITSSTDDCGFEADNKIYNYSCTQTEQLKLRDNLKTNEDKELANIAIDINSDNLTKLDYKPYHNGLLAVSTLGGVKDAINIELINSEGTFANTVKGISQSPREDSIKLVVSQDGDNKFAIINDTTDKVFLFKDNNDQNPTPVSINKKESAASISCTIMKDLYCYQGYNSAIYSDGEDLNRREINDRGNSIQSILKLKSAEPTITKISLNDGRIIYSKKISQDILADKICILNNENIVTSTDNDSHLLLNENNRYKIKESFSNFTVNSCGKKILGSYKSQVYQFNNNGQLSLFIDNEDLIITNFSQNSNSIIAFAASKEKKPDWNIYKISDNRDIEKAISKTENDLSSWYLNINYTSDEININGIVDKGSTNLIKKNTTESLARNGIDLNKYTVTFNLRTLDLAPSI